MQQQPRELGFKGLRSLGRIEVAVCDRPFRDRGDHSIDDLTQRTLTRGRAERASEVLLGDDICRRGTPVPRELDIWLGERHSVINRVHN